MENSPMSEEAREAAFPVHVELGEEPLTLSVGGLGADIPKSGCALVDYTLDDKGNMVVSTLCLPDPEAVSDEEDEPESLDAALGNSPLEEKGEGEDPEED